ncbi:DNA/RNA non-specific endonuclease [Fluviispira vulneris]|uniref:DNA/RNA non-specific endonuclease n=1 Tax=Fluviispira vulneris TaxID=2763012 RepID=UPI001647BAEB|nr:hemagglutinin repeat-containing protein [Fluviispira vulneris]
MSVSNSLNALGIDPKSIASVKVTETYGESYSGISNESKSQIAKESGFLAGGNINLHAWGAGKESTIDIIGSRVQAGNILKLKAEGDILAKASQNIIENKNKSESFNWDIGVGTVLGADTNGITLEGSISGNNGDTASKQVIQNNSHIIGSKKIIIESGGDTNLIGAVVKGEQVSGTVDGNLYIKSLQDYHTSLAKNYEYSANASVCIPPICAGASSGGALFGITNITSHYQSVIEQSGIQAGDGGYQIKVKGHTQLDGGVIASSKKAEEEKLNILDTGTFNYQDINNEAWFKAMQITGGINVDYVGGVSAVPPVPLYSSDAHSNVTKSTVGKGNIIIRDEAGQLALTGKTSQEIIAGVNRNSEDSHKPLEVIFDEEKIRAEFEIVKSFSKELGTFIQNKMKSEQAYEKELEERLNAGESKDSPSVIDLENKIEDLKKWAPGGTYRQISTALTAALSGNVGGTNIAFVQSFAANYLQSLGAEKIKEIADNIGGEGSPGHIALHALLGCAAGSVTNTCAEAAMGAAAGVVVNSLLDDPAELDPVQREKRKDLVTSIIAAIATGLGSENVAAITNSTQIETENNNLRTALNFVELAKEIRYESIINNSNKLKKNISEKISEVATAGEYILSFDEFVKEISMVSERKKRFEDLVSEYGEEAVAELILNKTLVRVLDNYKDPAVAIIVKNWIENFQSRGEDWLEKNNLSKDEQKLLTKQYDDTYKLLTGKKSLESVLKEQGENYLIEIGNEVRKKGLKIEKSINGDWVLLYQDVKRGKYLPSNTHLEIERPKLIHEYIGKQGEEDFIKLKSGDNGNWNPELRNPQKNSKYLVDNSTVYETDDQGRVKFVFAELKLQNKDRYSYEQTKVRKQGNPGDEGGHLIANRFGGPSEAINLVPMDSNLNRREWNKMENLWADALKLGDRVEVKIIPVYLSNGKRPDEFKVQYKIGNNKSVEKNFNNSPKGK